jgi:hypothetical protein
MAKPFRVGRKWGGKIGTRGRGTAAPIHFAAGEEGSASVAEGENERRPSGTDARTKGLAGGIGAAATPVEGGGGCSCSGKRRERRLFDSLRFFEWEAAIGRAPPTCDQLGREGELGRAHARRPAGEAARSDKF